VEIALKIFFSRMKVASENFSPQNFYIAKVGDVFK